MEKNINLNRFYDLFVGNTDSFILWDKDSMFWKRVYVPITKLLLIKHLNYEAAIGSYSIYIEDNIPYCKWICIDIDSHERIPIETRKEILETYDVQTSKKILARLTKEYKKKFDKDLKEKQFHLANFLYYNSEHNIYIPNENIILEDSVGGFHLWIFLKPNTLLEDVGKWFYLVKSELLRLNREFLGDDEEPPEVYPKQYKIDHLSKKVGNGVRLPLGYNFGKKDYSKILAGSIDTVKQYDLHDLVKDVVIKEENNNGYNYISRKDNEVFDAQDINDDLYFWMEMPLRPCFKRIIDGQTQCFGGTHGHIMRMALVHEARYYKMPKELIIKCFENQYDYDENMSRLQVNSVIESSNRPDGRYGCRTIKQLGYCHECEYDKSKI